MSVLVFILFLPCLLLLLPLQLPRCHEPLSVWEVWAAAQGPPSLPLSSDEAERTGVHYPPLRQWSHLQHRGRSEWGWDLDHSDRGLSMLEVQYWKFLCWTKTDWFIYMYLCMHPFHVHTCILMWWTALQLDLSPGLLHVVYMYIVHVPVTVLSLPACVSLMSSGVQGEESRPHAAGCGCCAAHLTNGPGESSHRTASLRSAAMAPCLPEDHSSVCIPVGSQMQHVLFVVNYHQGTRPLSELTCSSNFHVWRFGVHTYIL